MNSGIWLRGTGSFNTLLSHSCCSAQRCYTKGWVSNLVVSLQSQIVEDLVCTLKSFNIIPKATKQF